MEIIEAIETITDAGPCVLTVGTFDGFHRGHQFLLDHLRRISRSDNLSSTIVTFHPHPRKVLTGKPVPILTTRHEKLDIFRENGIDRVVMIRFTKAFAALSSHEFVRDYLVQRLNVRKMVIGYDHHFGHNREGDYENLNQLGEKYGFSAIQVPPFANDGQTISSSMIRQELKDGKVERAAIHLGRDYRMFGTVVRGEGRGSQLGFPTANIEPEDPDKLLPRNGVYAVEVILDDQTYKGMMNIGTRPTFEYDRLTLEVHLFNFRGLIYGKTLEIRFKAYVRPEKKFDSVEALKKQLKKDQKYCENY